MLGSLRQLFQRVHRSAAHRLVVDIGSSSAIRSLVLDCGGDGCTVLKKRSFELPRRERRAELLPAIEEYLRRLIFETIQEAERVPGRTLIGLGSQFTFNQMLTAHRTRPKPEAVIRTDEFEKLTRDFTKSNHERTHKGESYTLANLMPFRATVDGYEILEPNQNTRGTAIEIVFFATYVADNYWESLNHLKSHWGGLALEFRSNQGAIAAAAVELLGVGDALILKLAGRVTEVSLLSQGVIVATGQIGVGADSFTDVVANALGIGAREAEILKRQWDTLALPRERRRTAEQAFRAAIEAWIETLVKFLRDEERFILPERVYLLGGGARLPLVAEILSSRHWYGELTFLEKLDLKVLSGREIAEKVFTNTQMQFDGPEDVALAALAYQAAKR